MRHALAPFFVLLFLSSVLPAQTIWDGPEITFTKSAFSNPADANNQDRITDLVWITRGNVQGLYNAKTESGYSPISPAGTQWAKGTTADLGSLDFSTWQEAVESNPPGNLNEAFVLHLIEEDIYIDLIFTQWGQQASGGGSFSYRRSTEPTTSVAEADPNETLNVYPNPASSVIYLEGYAPGNFNTHYKIYSAAGAVHTREGEIAEDGSVDVRDLPGGSYYLVVGNNTVLRFIKVE